jgi:hypothetical protein
MDMVWVNGEYDALDLGSLTAVAKDTARSLAAAYHLRVAQETAVYLAELPAREIIMRGNNGRAGTNYMRLVVAFRPLPDSDIIYTVGVKAHSDNKISTATFFAVVASFQATTP